MPTHPSQADDLGSVPIPDAPSPQVREVKPFERRGAGTGLGAAARVTKDLSAPVERIVPRGTVQPGGEFTNPLILGEGGSQPVLAEGVCPHPWDKVTVEQHEGEPWNYCLECNTPLGKYAPPVESEGIAEDLSAPVPPPPVPAAPASLPAPPTTLKGSADSTKE